MSMMYPVTALRGLADLFRKHVKGCVCKGGLWDLATESTVGLFVSYLSTLITLYRRPEKDFLFVEQCASKESRYK